MTSRKTYQVPLIIETCTRTRFSSVTCTLEVTTRRITHGGQVSVIISLGVSSDVATIPTLSQSARRTSDSKTRIADSLGGGVIVRVASNVDHVGSLVHADIIDVHVVGLQEQIEVNRRVSRLATRQGLTKSRFSRSTNWKLFDIPNQQTNTISDPNPRHSTRPRISTHQSSR